MGLEPMTSPLPRECSTTELHQPFNQPYPSYRERRYPSTTRKAKKPNRIQVSERNLPGAMVCHASQPSTANATSAIAKRPLPAGLRSTATPTICYRLQKNGAQGRIRTSVAHNAADLQSAAINHSATCAAFACREELENSHSPPNPDTDSAANRSRDCLEGVV